jgi:Ca2+-binding EF-hand superfamily protein
MVTRYSRDTIHDGLIARNGVVKVYWEENEDQSDEEFEDLPEEAVYVTYC